MRSVRNRLAQLERLEDRSSMSDNAAILCEKLARIELHVLASGDLSDNSGASLMERTVRRCLRGEAEIGNALRDLLEGRWP